MHKFGKIEGWKFVSNNGPLVTTKLIKGQGFQFSMSIVKICHIFPLTLERQPIVKPPTNQPPRENPDSPEHSKSNPRFPT